MTDSPPADAAPFASSFEWSGRRFIVVAYDPLPPALAMSLTEAERAVVLGVLEGLTDRAIAERRGTRARTVHNQLARIYKKLGVSSRGELVARCEAGPGPEG